MWILWGEICHVGFWKSRSPQIFGTSSSLSSSSSYHSMRQEMEEIGKQPGKQNPAQHLFPGFLVSHLHTHNHSLSDIGEETT